MFSISAISFDDEILKTLKVFVSSLFISSLLLPSLFSSFDSFMLLVSLKSSVVHEDINITDTVDNDGFVKAVEKFVKFGVKNV